VRVWVILAAGAAMLAGCQTTDEIVAPRAGQAALQLSDGRSAGAARLLANGQLLDLSVTAAGLAHGAYSVSLHGTGQCAPSGFATAGSRLNFDLPQLDVGAGGAATVSATLPGDRAGLLAQLFDTDGTAVVIIGDSARVACGVLTR
jgi:Cu-Zn family superoxide dismutase